MSTFQTKFFFSFSRFLFFFFFFFFFCFLFLCFSFMVSSSWKHALHLKEFSSILLLWWKRMSWKDKIGIFRLIRRIPKKMFCLEKILVVPQLTSIVKTLIIRQRNQFNTELLYKQKLSFVGESQDKRSDLCCLRRKWSWIHSVTILFSSKTCNFNWFHHAVTQFSSVSKKISHETSSLLSEYIDKLFPNRKISIH